MTTAKGWDDLSPDERREDRFSRWLSPPGIHFACMEVKNSYKAKVARFIKAIKLEEPDRVPAVLPV